MPFVGLSSTLLPKEDCIKYYNTVITYQIPFLIQNAFKQPKAKTYVANLIAEAPAAKQTGKLAVVTGVTIGGAGYHAAEELALQGGFHVVMLGRSERKLKAAMKAIEQEAARRKVGKPVLYETPYDLDSLKSAKSAANYVIKLAKAKYDGKLNVLLNNAGMVAANPAVTSYGVEANMGRNFLTVHYLTELLLPILKAAATADYKPRVVDVASISHLFGVTHDPARLLEFPKQGGAPEGRIKEHADGTISFVEDSMEGSKFCYGRAKMAPVAITKYMQTKHPELNFTCLHPGSIVSNFGGDAGIAAKIYYYGFYLFQYGPSQGAVTMLRACLDPDFNTESDLQGAYLHCDGNPWYPLDPTTIDPKTNEPYKYVAYGKATAEAADKLIKKLG